MIKEQIKELRQYASERKGEIADICTRAADTIEALQPKIGKWIHREDMDYLDKNKVVNKHFMCGECGFIHNFKDGHTSQYKYCPNCGKPKMQEVEE